MNKKFPSFVLMVALAAVVVFFISVWPVCNVEASGTGRKMSRITIAEERQARALEGILSELKKIRKALK